MIVILDTAKGESYNFRFRKEAAEFMGVSLPTLRGWLGHPFFLYKTLIITHTSNEKIRRSNHALLKRHMEKIGNDESERRKPANLSGVLLPLGDIPINNSRPQESA